LVAVARAATVHSIIAGLSLLAARFAQEGKCAEARDHQRPSRRLGYDGGIIDSYKTG
jgi:hypothetical protein